MLSHYLGPSARIVGNDIDDAARSVAGRHVVETGDQEDPVFLASVVERHGPFDIVMDDGATRCASRSNRSRPSFRSWPMAACISSRTRTRRIGRRTSTRTIPRRHSSVDQGPARRSPRLPPFDELDLAEPWQTNLVGVHGYDSVVVLDKAERYAPFSEVSGTNDYINATREASAANLELLATRQVAMDRAQEAEEDAARRIDEAQRRLADAEARAREAEEAAHDEVRILRAELVSAGQNTAQARAELDLTKAELDDTSSKLLGSWEILREMRRSRSWQMTAPLRRSRRLGRR